MKKTVKTLGLAVFVVLMTATFGFAEYTTASVSEFPYFQLGCLIIGGMMGHLPEAKISEVLCG